MTGLQGREGVHRFCVAEVACQEQRALMPAYAVFMTAADMLWIVRSCKWCCLDRRSIMVLAESSCSLYRPDVLVETIDLRETCSNNVSNAPGSWNITKALGNQHRLHSALVVFSNCQGKL